MKCHMGWDGMTCVGTYLLSVCGLHMSSVVWLSLCVLFNLHKEQWYIA